MENMVWTVQTTIHPIQYRNKEIQFAMQHTKITTFLHLYCLCTAFWVPSNIYSAHQEVVVLYFMANLTHYRLFITGFMMWKMIGLLLLRTCPAPAACSIYKTRTYQQTFAISRPSGNCNIGKSASDQFCYNLVAGNQSYYIDSSILVNIYFLRNKLYGS